MLEPVVATSLKEGTLYSIKFDKMIIEKDKLFI